jgi:hypothetical protein
VSHTNPDVVFLSLTLIETIVKNGREAIFTAVNDEAFMKEMEKVPKKVVLLDNNICHRFRY